MARLRAVVPPGPFELTGPADVAGRSESWLGGPGEFEVLDAAIGQVGADRRRARPAVPGPAVARAER
ncbi:hypothetical protein [Nocardia niigatensis]|uniref:hypothetical protein n=1 Tax=Nocardia niigatensis TaxID=209249 RepID=UPI0003058B44|nr:hypothetical protein [Nocardia niigatensis]